MIKTFPTAITLLTCFCLSIFALEKTYAAHSKTGEEKNEKTITKNDGNYNKIFLDKNQEGTIVKIGKQGEFKLGLRTQFKYSYSEPDKSNDFMIRRTRLKAEGSIYQNTRFKLEWKIDDVGQEGKNPSAQAEDISFFIDNLHPNVQIRMGLFDAPFSRDGLTSDSKLLFMDRSDVFEQYKSEGLTDNTVGVSFYGFAGKHVEYHIGIYDNEKWDNATTQLMPMGRLVLHVLDREKGEYQAAYPGDDKNYLNLGASFGTLGNIETDHDTLDLRGLELDLFIGLKNGFSFQGEFGRINRVDYADGGPDINSEGILAQSGYILPSKIGPGKVQLAYRFQSYDPNKNISNDRYKKHSFGLNYYLTGHNTKIQADYTITVFDEMDNLNAFQIQYQVDF